MKDYFSTQRERDDSLFHDLFNLGYSTTEAMSKYGLSRSAIDKLKKAAMDAGWEYDSDYMSQRKQRKSKQGHKPLSMRHAFIGLRIEQYRLANKLKITELAAEMQMGRGKTSQIIKGTFDLQLTEVAKIAQFLKVDMISLLTTPEIKVKNAS